MVGHFGPLIKALQDRQAQVEVIDESRQVGDKAHWTPILARWAEVLVLTSTALLNDTAESLLQQTAPGVRTVLLGPSTPMVPEAFDGFAVDMLAGMVPIEKERLLKGVRHGAGTPFLQRCGKKVYWSRL